MQKEDTTPLYKKLIEDLKRLIEEGKLKEGDLLPSENELSKAYNTTRPTVRQALAGLTNAGYITRHHGKGSIVAEPRPGLGILSLSGVTAGVGDLNLRTVILEKPVKRNWPPELMKDLNNSEQIAGCIYFTRVRIINNAPILYEETFLSDMNLPRFISRNLDNRSLLKILSENYQVEVKSGEQKIWAVAANKTISRLLKISVGHPIVHMKRKLKTNVKDLNIYSWLYCNTEHYHLYDRF